MDFGPSASDYERFRRGFPPSFFAAVPLVGRVLDVGSGTGSIARGYAATGSQVVALDIALAMLARAGARYPSVVARAEELPFRASAFDAVVAGQCWHWLDGERAAAEARRVLVPGGLLVIAHFDYLARDGNAAAVSEAAVLRASPSWPLAASSGRYDRWRPHLLSAGFEGISSFYYEEDVVYTQEAWRGRMRACNAALRLPNDAARAALDADIAASVAASFSDPLVIPHGVFVMQGR